MKKLVSFCLAVIMIFAILPVSAFAAENTLSEQEQLFAEAREVFPEYASLIHRNTVATCVAPAGENPIVSVETRNISDTESMSIVQYANSDVIVVKKAYSYTKLTNTGSSVSNVGTDKIGKASFQASCTNAAGVFKYQNVGFIITQSGSGNFTSYGSSSTSGDIRIGSNSRSTTQINYALTFNYSSASKVYLEFSLYFSGGKLIAYLG